MPRRRSRNEMDKREYLEGSSTRIVEGLVTRKNHYTARGSLDAEEQLLWRDLQGGDGANGNNATDTEVPSIPLNSANSSTPIDPLVDDDTTNSIAAAPLLNQIPTGRNSSSDNLYQLETTFQGANGNNGAMFDVSSTGGDHEIQIISVDVHTNLIQEDCPITLYGRPGTHVGFESTTVGWSLLVNTTVHCKGLGEHTVIPPSAFQEAPVLKGGEIYAFYAQMPTPNIRYGNGREVGAIYSSNQFLNIHEGTGVADFFGGETQSFVRPRVWNGMVAYELISNDIASKTEFAEGCDGTLTTTYDDNLGSFGNMFDVSTQDLAIEVHGVDFYTDLVEPVTYEIYTRAGTYTDGMYLNSTQRLNLVDDALSNGLDNNVMISNVVNMRNLNWTLVKRGTVIGGGSGQGTPVRNFVPFTIPPNSLQGFYITLTKADMRYRDISIQVQDAIVGDTYFQNGDLEIQVGVSVGTYPGGAVYYGPRVWSGAILYTADRACPSEVPTEIPSMAPSIAPSNMASLVPSLGDPDYGNCTDVATLQTTLSGGTGSYGNMFTVTSKEPVSVTSLDINAATTDLIYVEVYTKDGGYKGFAEDSKSWRIVAAANITGAGNGAPTRIPDQEFDDVHMRANETRAFYVTLSTADIKYTRTNAEVGEALVSDGFLAVNAGAGLAAPDFGGSLFEPRVFNGAVHYRYEDNCIEQIVTTVMYNFKVQHDGTMTEAEVIESVDENVLTTVSALVEIDSTLRTFATEYDFELTNTLTQKTGTGDCAATAADRICTAIETRVAFSHESTLDQGKILFAMLQYKDTIGINLNLAQFEAEYDGDIPIQSDVIISLGGNFTAGLSDSERIYFEAITRAYLSDQLLKIGVSVLNVAVVSINDRRFLQRNNDDEVVFSGNSIDISTVIDGSYRPPPNIDFSAVVEDAIDAEGGSNYQDDLTNGRRDVPQDIVNEVGAFQTVTSVKAEAVSRDDPSPVPTIAPKADEGDWTVTVIVLGGVLGGLAIIFVIFVWCYFFVWCCCKRRRKVLKSGGVFGDKSSQYILGGDALEADCNFASSGDEYLHDQYPGLPTKDEDYVGDTTGTVGSGSQDQWGGLQGPDTAFGGGPQHVLAQSLPADVTASRSEMAMPAFSGVNNIPPLRRGMSESLDPNPNGRARMMGSVSRSSASLGVALMARERSMANMGVGGARNVGQRSPNMNLVEQSMSSMGSVGRSTDSAGTLMTTHERSIANMGVGSIRNVGRRSPNMNMMEQSMSSMGSTGRSTDSSGAPMVTHERSMVNMGVGSIRNVGRRSPNMNLMERSMNSMGSGGRNPGGSGMMTRERSMANRGISSAGQRSPNMNTMARSMSSVQTPHDQFENEDQQYTTRHSGTPNQQMGFAPVSPARRFGEEEIGSVSSGVSGFHASYQHRDDRQSSPNPHGWQDHSRPMYDERPQNLYDSRSQINRPIMGRGSSRSPVGRPRSSPPPYEGGAAMHHQQQGW